jgi:small subunit ribosomal protein S13
MARIAGINIPDNKIVLISLTYIFGIGRSKAIEICKNTNINPNAKISSLNNEDLDKIRNYIDKSIKNEGDLKLSINQNIKRLKEISCNRGIRHIKKLPVRGQRTKTNARTKRGKKICVGSGRKPSAEKT